MEKPCARFEVLTVTVVKMQVSWTCRRGYSYVSVDWAASCFVLRTFWTEISARR